MLKLIYYSHDIVPKKSTILHKHDFWQLEIALAGEIILETPDTKSEMSPYETILIPPGLTHSFTYHSEANEYYSIKFEFPHRTIYDNVIAVPDDNNSRILKDTLFSFLSGKKIIMGKEAEVAGFIIEAILKLSLPDELPDDILIARAKDYINKNALRPVMVSEIARHLQCSISGLNQKFRNTLGISLKKYIDAERGRLIQSYLLYSNLTLAQIAEKLDFPDVYSFSRFCKRTNGMYPGKLRKKHLQ